MDAVADAPGALVLDASVSTPGDPLTANDSLRRGVWIDSRVRVLYVVRRRALTTCPALTGSGFDVTERSSIGPSGNRCRLRAV
jgi:hypothetical protein